MYTRIKQLRKALRLSQSEFANRINISQGYFSRIEVNLSRVSDGVVNDICAVFGVNEEWLRKGIGEMFPDQAPTTEKIGGERIRQARAGMSQKEFGQKIGVLQHQVSLIERGKSQPPDRLVRRIAGVCNVSYDWLIRGVGEMAMEYKVDEEMIRWFEENPDAIVEIRNRMRRKIDGCDSQGAQ